MHEALRDACETVDADPTARTAVIRGAGENAFVAGTDIHQSLDLKDSADGLTYERWPEGVIDRREAVRVPTKAVSTATPSAEASSLLPHVTFGSRAPPLPSAYR